MAITCVSVENFKPFRDRVNIPLKPITVFIGANSAGKSSAIHALAALKQSAQRQLPGRALLLDGPDALVSLGRYVDAVHAHDYRKQIGLGIKFEANLQVYDFTSGGRVGRRVQTADLEYWWRFHGTLRTQRVLLASRSCVVLGHEFQVKRRPKTSEYIATLDQDSSELNVVQVQNLAVRVQAPLRSSTEEEFRRYAAWQMLNAADEAMLRELERIQYLGPFRYPPQRLYAYHGTSPGVGPDGRGAIPLLISEITGHQRRPNLQYVQEWLQRLGLIHEMKVSRQGTSDYFRVEVKASDRSEVGTPADIGFGFSQVLPVLVQCAFAEEGGTYLFEQPEIHLHPTAQRRLGLFFADALNRRRATYVLETHSRYLIYGLQDAVRDGVLNGEDVIVYAVRSNNGISALRSYRIDEGGDLWDEWERGFVEPWE